MESPNTSIRLSTEDQQRLDHLQDQLGQSRTDVIRTGLRLLERELAARQDRVTRLVLSLSEYLPAFDTAAIEDHGFDPARDRAYVRVDDVTYIDTPARPLVFSERRREDGTIVHTKVEPGGENPAKTIEILPPTFVN